MQTVQRRREHEQSVGSDSVGSGSADVNTVLKTCMTDVDFSSMAMSIVMVRLRHDSNPQNEVVVYAALDGMSSASFISEEVLNKLGASGEQQR